MAKRCARRGLWLTVLVALSHAVRAQSALTPPQPTTLPFVFSGGVIIVPASIGTSPALPFVLDTGAGQTLIRADHIGDPGAGASVSVPSAAGLIAGRKILVNRFCIGSGRATLSCGPTAVLVSNKAVIPSPPGVRACGILGMDVLAHWCLQFDFVRSCITFWPGGARPELKWDSHNAPVFTCLLTRDNGGVLPDVSVNVGGDSPFDALVDTGYTGLMLMPYSCAVSAGFVEQHYPRIVVTAQTPAGAYKIAKARAQTLTIAGIDASGRVVDIDERTDGSAPTFGFVGTQFLRYFNIVLDLPAGRITLQRNSLAESPNPLIKPSLGLTVKAFPAWLLVTTVVRLSPAQQAGIHPGDRITAIGRHDVRDLTGAASRLVNAAAPILLHIQPAVDPNLGTIGPVWAASISPSAPIDWGRQER
ncbi:MAG: PDZ domain-containing protein [Armatimonadetes bacterium]|nr:PDZ domain-containing protein [Armatimonadota bacterium]MDE2206526.1 PDZ domain-containing protein [Armatimonadota bacterium]